MGRGRVHRCRGRRRPVRPATGAARRRRHVASHHYTGKIHNDLAVIDTTPQAAVLATGPPPVPPSGAHGLCLRDAWTVGGVAWGTTDSPPCSSWRQQPRGGLLLFAGGAAGCGG